MNKVERITSNKPLESGKSCIWENGTFVYFSEVVERKFVYYWNATHREKERHIESADDAVDKIHQIVHPENPQMEVHRQNVIYTDSWIFKIEPRDNGITIIDVWRRPILTKHALRRSYQHRHLITRDEMGVAGKKLNEERRLLKQEILDVIIDGREIPHYEAESFNSGKDHENAVLIQHGRYIYIFSASDNALKSIIPMRYHLEDKGMWRS